MTEITHSIEAPLASRSMRFLDRIWPVAVVAIGLMATAAWLCLLTYAFVSLLEITL
jgi:hypothetical protein